MAGALLQLGFLSFALMPLVATLRLHGQDPLWVRRCGQRFADCPDGPLPSCVSVMSATPPKVSFALVTGSNYTTASAGRPWAQLDTWLQAVQPGSWAYFSDVQDTRLPAYEIPGTAGGWKASQKKWLGILELLAAGAAPFDAMSFFPGGTSWLFIGDDDTFVWLDALTDRLEGLGRDPDKEIMYLGLPDSGIAKAVGIDLGEVHSYCLGGAGFLLSRKLALALSGQDIRETCGSVFDDGAHADVALARCLARTVGVQSCEHLSGLNQQPFPFNSSAGDDMELDGEGDYPRCAPASFHWMKPSDMRQLWSLEK